MAAHAPGRVNPFALEHRIKAFASLPLASLQPTGRRAPAQSAPPL